MIVASNFKMNHTRASTRSYLEQVSRHLEGLSSDIDVMVFAPASCWDHYNLPANLRLGAQNGYPAARGSLTGEHGLEQMREFGISTILLGHSERRHFFGEDQALIAKKVAFYASEGFRIVYCIGEPLEVRKRGEEALHRYLLEQLEGIDIGYANLIIAYEPVWAIGTGVSATPEEIASTHAFLATVVGRTPLLYGGSVNLCGLEDILRLPHVDGVLVGTASWKAEDFCMMLTIASKLYQGEVNGDEGKKGPYYRCGQ
ncbi:MAG: triose-phosphate isomerase [Campylobacterales bacterium]